MIGVDALIISGFVFKVMNYSDKLKSPKWQKKRLEILNRDNFKCCLCGDEETELHVHHLKYSGPNPENTSNENLETLCKHCHWAKTYLTDNDYGEFKKAVKINGYFILIEKSGIISLYKIEDRYLDCYVRFKNKSELGKELMKQFVETWDLKFL